MKNYLFKLSLLFSLLLPFSAFAIQDVTLTTDMVINVAGINVTLAGNVDSDGLTVTNNDFTLTLSNNASVTIISTDRRTMTITQPAGGNQLNTSFACSASDSRYTITNPTAGATGLQITIAPTATVCTSGGGSGGGSSGGGSSGGGGGGGSPAPSSAAPAVNPSPAVAVAASASSQGPSSSGAAVSPALISVAVKLGERSDNVKKLQDGLEAGGFLKMPSGVTKGFFGAQTRAAIQKFQEKYGIAKKGDVGYGNLGPKTRAKFNEVYAGSPAPAPASTASISDLLKKLQDLQNQLKLLK